MLAGRARSMFARSCKRGISRVGVASVNWVLRRLRNSSCSSSAAAEWCYWIIKKHWKLRRRNWFFAAKLFTPGCPPLRIRRRRRQPPVVRYSVPPNTAQIVRTATSYPTYPKYEYPSPRINVPSPYVVRHWRNVAARQAMNCVEERLE